MQKSDGRHETVITRTEPNGDFKGQTCFASAPTAERYAQAEAIIVARGRGGYTYTVNERDVRVRFVDSEAEWTVKVMPCYSIGCSLFRRMPKSHKGLVS